MLHAATFTYLPDFCVGSCEHSSRKAVPNAVSIGQTASNGIHTHVQQLNSLNHLQIPLIRESNSLNGYK